MDSLSRIENQRWDRKPQNKSCKQLLTLVSPFYVIAHCLPPKGRGALPLHVLTTLSTGAKVHYSKVVSDANFLLLSFVVTSLRFALARELLMCVSRGGGLQKTILFLRTTTHTISFAATRLCLVTGVTKNCLATVLCGHNEDFGCCVGNKLVASQARMGLK